MRHFQPDPSGYEIERNVGEGLNASVFKAIRIDGQARSRQPVALKFLKDKTAVDFLRREFETLSKVRSAHCGRVLAWESQGDDCVLVLEWIEGPTLYDLAERYALKPCLVQELIAQIYQGLLDLRLCGLHHGDLHPRNIMIDTTGTVRLVDFSAGRISKDVIQGHPAFLAPENRRGEETSFEADLFALGVVETGLYQGFHALPHRAPTTGEGWCADEQAQRLQRTPQPSPSKNELRELIRRYLSECAVSSTQVIDLKSSPHRDAVSKAAPKSRLSLRAAGLLAALTAIFELTAPVKAEAPLLQHERRASVRVNTQNWTELTLNGRVIGFAPIAISGLRPGTHRLSWHSAYGAGTLQIELKSGEDLRISESRLRAMSKLVKR